MPEMKTLTIDGVTYEIVDAKSREGTVSAATINDSGHLILTRPSGEVMDCGDATGPAGKSAYEFAKEAGYTGTEEEFGEKLAQEMLFGISADITPTQVQEAIAVGRDVWIAYADKTFGLFGFTSFDTNVNLNVIFASSILQYNGMYAVVELIGYLDNDTWDFVVQQIPIMSDVPAKPLIGTTTGITPSQVKALMDGGKPFAITHVDTVYGLMLFNSFVHSQAVGTQILSSTVFQIANATLCAQLFGDFSNNTWSFSVFELAAKSDIPTKNSQLDNDSGYMTLAGYQNIAPTALKNPYALTINGTSYDGSSAKDFTSIINAMIDAKIAAITNAEEVAY